MEVNNRYRLIPIVALSAMFSTQTLAVGFQVAEHSASGLGRAFSGEAAVAEDASVLALIPAAITRFDSMIFSGALSIVDPQIDITDNTFNEKAYDIAPMQFVPVGYLATPINDSWSWGIGMFTTYGVGLAPGAVASGVYLLQLSDRMTGSPSVSAVLTQNVDFAVISDGTSLYITPLKPFDAASE